MATFMAYVSAEKAHAVFGVADSLAREATTPGDERSIDERRADAAIVTDQSGGVLPGVTVDAINAGTNTTRSVQTGPDGYFSIPLAEVKPSFLLGRLESDNITRVNCGSRPHHCRTTSRVAADHRVCPTTGCNTSPART